MKTRDVLISGAGIAGPSLAYWLLRNGMNPTIVEQAPSLRRGGQAVDFRGPVHLSILERMGILDDIRRVQTHGGALDFVDADNNVLASLPAKFAGGEVEVARGDLSHILYAATKDSTEYVFGDSIRSLTETDRNVQVTFEKASPRAFDLVIGADGLHSNVRALAFGAETEFVQHLGYYVAFFSTANILGLRNSGVLYNEPGKAAGSSSGLDGQRGGGMFFFASPRLDCDRRDIDAQKQIVAGVFAGSGWKVPQLVDAMWKANDFYLDSISRVKMASWSRGRVALLGDAGYGGTIGGMGSGVAVVCAYVLAGELSRTDDHTVAYARYAERIGQFARRCQKGADGVGPFMAPKTRAGAWGRNLLFRASRWLPGMDLMERMAMRQATGIVLERYEPI